MTKKDKITIFRSPLLVTGNGPVIEDGAVIVSQGNIIDVGTYSQLHNECTNVVDCEGQILIPALINCHAHLELSWMADLDSDDEFEYGNITSWIQGLLKKRDHNSPSNDLINAAARKALSS